MHMILRAMNIAAQRHRKIDETIVKHSLSNCVLINETNGRGNEYIADVQN
jgi:hypothetical protein